MRILAGRVLITFLMGVGVVLYWLGLHGALIRVRRHRPRVLAYHAFEPAETDLIRGLGCNTPPDRFREQLGFLLRHYNIVPLDALAHDQMPERALVLTMDDGYRSVYTQAFPMLRERGLSATVFLVGNVMRHREHIWINKLNWLLRRAPSVAVPLARQRLRLPDGVDAPEFVRRAQETAPEHVMDLIEVLSRATGGSEPLPAPNDVYISWAEMDEMARAGFTAGNHTWSHPNLALLDEDAQRAEIAWGRDAIAGQPGVRSALALPFGRGNAATLRVARQLGCMTMWVGYATPFGFDVVPRVPVADQPPARLFALLEIVEPLKAWVRRVEGHCDSEAGPITPRHPSR